MRLPRDASGRSVSASLCKHWGYVNVHQTGSHIILETQDPFHHRVCIPDHKELRVGTLNAIVRSVSGHKGIPRDRLIETL